MHRISYEKKYLGYNRYETALNLLFESMQPSFKRLSIFLGFGLLVAVLAINGFITQGRVGAQIRSHSWVAHTLEVLLQISETESLLKDAETGERGYLLTGDTRYLAAYNAAMLQVGGNIEKIRTLTIDNVAQQSKMQQLQFLTKMKLDELSTSIQLYQAGKISEARSASTMATGMDTTRTLHALLAEMANDERQLAQMRTADYDRATRNTMLSIFLTTSIAAIAVVLLCIHVLAGIREREAHTREINQREERLRVTLTSIGDAVISTNKDGEVTFINPIAEQLTGFSLSEVVGQPVQNIFPIFNELTHKPVSNPVKKVMESGIIVGLANHTVLQNRKGDLIPIEDSAAPIRDDQNQLIGVVMVFRDVRQERTAQDMLRRAEKLAATGRLAATIAHEINNPLEAVSNLMYLIKTSPEFPSALNEYLETAEQQLERVSHITRQTLGFYRESTKPVVVKLSDLVNSTVRLYEHKLQNKNVSLECQLADSAIVHGFAGELKQLIANLISNAADAVGVGGGIKVAVHPASSPQDRVRLVIEDNGPGIPRENLQKIFEPFFTTKRDVGTGLGLWITKEIAERHDGHIEVQSRVGSADHGTRFSVYLPPAEQHLAEAAG